MKYLVSNVQGKQSMQSYIFNIEQDTIHRKYKETKTLDKFDKSYLSRIGYLLSKQ